MLFDGLVANQMNKSPSPMSVLIETSVGKWILQADAKKRDTDNFPGNLVIDLFIDESSECCENFLKLCKTKFYNYSPFYDVQSDFVVECGDPCYPIGDGGRAYSARTIPVTSSLRHGDIGLVSFVNSGTVAAPLVGSKFFITLTDDRSVLQDLDGSGVVFGKVVEGFQTLQTINSAITDETRRPIKDIRIRHTYLLDDPFPDPDALVVPPSPRPSVQQMSTFQLVYEKEAEDEKEVAAKSQALTLELLGDLPSADAKPMENVLFVCKLNPLTQDEDLRTIFSRFGRILSCEVVKDRQTGQSLQYAFIEFDTKEACERAYLKMDNVLIDDRRIHVDFSQSVKKLSDKWRRNRR